MAVDKQGNIIVCDKDNHRIQRFTKDGVFINKFGGFGENQGKLKRPWGVSIGNDDEIIVTDRKNSRIQILERMVVLFEYLVVMDMPAKSLINRTTQ